MTSSKIRQGDKQNCSVCFQLLECMQSAPMFGSEIADFI